MSFTRQGPPKNVPPRSGERVLNLSPQARLPFRLIRKAVDHAFEVAQKESKYHGKVSREQVARAVFNELEALHESLVSAVQSTDGRAETDRSAVSDPDVRGVLVRPSDLGGRLTRYTAQDVERYSGSQEWVMDEDVAELEMALGTLVTRWRDESALTISDTSMMICADDLQRLLNGRGVATDGPATLDAAGRNPALQSEAGFRPDTKGPPRQDEARLPSTQCARCHGTGLIPSETCFDCVDCQDACPCCKGAGA